MSAADLATAGWRKGIQDVSREAAGAVGVVILMQSELPALLANALLGDPESIRLLQLTAQLLTRIEAAPKREGMLCACCPRPIKRRGGFNIGLAIPARDDAQSALAIAICTRCASGPDDVLARSIASFRKVWPDLRAATITHPAGGRA